MALEVLNLLVLLPSLSSSPRWVGTHALQAKMSTVSAATILTQSLAGLGLCCSSYILSAWGTAFANTRGRQAGRALMPARLGGLMVQPRGRVRPLRRTKAAHNERKRAWISPPSWKIARFSFHGAIQRWLQKDEDDLCILARPKPSGLTPAFGSFCKR